MPLTTYTAGEVLTAASLNANLSFAASNGLTLISTTTIGTTVSSVTVTGAFSATYDAYKIIITGGAGSTTNIGLGLQLGSTTTGYYNGMAGTQYSTGNAFNSSDNNTSNFTSIGTANPEGIQSELSILNPFAAKFTSINGSFAFSSTANLSRSFNGYVNNTTSYTAFTITTSTGTLTGGTIRVYGYQNS